MGRQVGRYLSFDETLSRYFEHVCELDMMSQVPATQRPSSGAAAAFLSVLRPQLADCFRQPPAGSAGVGLSQHP